MKSTRLVLGVGAIITVAAIAIACGIDTSTSDSKNEPSVDPSGGGGSEATSSTGGATVGASATAATSAVGTSPAGDVDAGASECGLVGLPTDVATWIQSDGSPPTPQGGKMKPGTYRSTKYMDYRTAAVSVAWRARLRISDTLDRLDMIKVGSGDAVTNWSGTLSATGVALSITLDCPEKSAGKVETTSYTAIGDTLTLIGANYAIEYVREP